MPSRIHAICNPVLLFHVAIHSSAPTPSPFAPYPACTLHTLPSPSLHQHHLFYIRRRHHRSTNPRTGKSRTQALLIANVAAGFMLHFLSPIKMQLRLFDKARVAAHCTPFSTLYPRSHSFGPDGNAAIIILRGKIARREMSTFFTSLKCKFCR